MRQWDLPKTGQVLLVSERFSDVEPHYVHVNIGSRVLSEHWTTVLKRRKQATFCRLIFLLQCHSHNWLWNKEIIPAMGISLSAVSSRSFRSMENEPVPHYLTDWPVVSMALRAIDMLTRVNKGDMSAPPAGRGQGAVAVAVWDRGLPAGQSSTPYGTERSLSGRHLSHRRFVTSAESRNSRS